MNNSNYIGHHTPSKAYDKDKSNKISKHFMKV